MTTINAVGNALVGTTGTGNFVGANTPTLITPVLGVATGTSLAIGGGSLNSTVEITNTSSGATTNLLRLTNATASGINSGVSLTFQPNAISGRAASIRSLQTTAGNYADLEFYTCNADVPAFAMAINTVQQVLVGTTTAVGGSQFQVVGVNNIGAELISTYVNSASGSSLRFLKSRSTTVGVQTTVQNGDALTLISTFADDGTSFPEASRISSNVTGAVSTGIVPSELRFATMDSSGVLSTGMVLSSARILSLTNALAVTSGGSGVTTSTGSTNLVLSNSPTLVAPVLGAATATSINFGGTTLSTYAEGTWTPADTSGAGLTFTSVVARYTRIGRLVIAQCTLTFPVTADATQTQIGGLPFAVANSNGALGGSIGYSSQSTLTVNTTQPLVNTSNVTLYVTNTRATNVQCSAATFYLTYMYTV